MSTLNFNKHRPPILKVEMMDEEGTVLHITPPTVDLQEELRASLPELNAMLNSEAKEQRVALFDLAARLMSCNRNMLKITPQQLHTTYGLDAEDLVVFYEAYANFLSGIENAKN